MAARRDAAPFGDVMSLQSTIGNAAVGNLMRSHERAMSESATPVDAYTQSLIARQQGGSEVIDGPAPSGVRIHHGPESDALTRRLGAAGFTQGQDVFLRSDRGLSSQAGRATLAHELTHVGQGSVGTGAVLREPATDEAIPTDAGSPGKERARVPAAVAMIELEKSGPVRGGSKAAGHDGEVDIDSFQFASTGPVSKTDGKPTDITISKAVDVATIPLTKAIASGERVLTARFVFIKRKDDGTTEDGLALEFRDGFITSYSTGGSGSGIPSESVSFQFAPNEGRT